jgi:signal transduction histidine kinase
MRLDLLHKIGEKVGSVSDLSKLVEQIVKMTQHAIEASASSVLLLDDSGNDLVFDVVLGGAKSTLRHLRISTQSGIAGWVARNSKPLIVNDVGRDERFNQKIDNTTGFVTRSIMCAPMIVQRKVIGVLEVLNKNDGTDFSVQNLETLLSVASTAAMAIENLRLNKSAIDEYENRIRTQEQLRHSQLLASLGEMTAGIAHEISNPLSSILLHCDLMLSEEMPSGQSRDLRVVRDEAKRASKIMRSLLTYSHQSSPRLRRLDLHKVLNKVMNMRLYTGSARSITAYKDLVSGPLHIRGDSSQLTQVFVNLLLNAEDAIRESGRANGGNITVASRIHGKWAEVSVADDGTGVSEEKLSQVFNPFFTTKAVGKGTGLGLSTCQAIVTDHNGLIRVENNDMGGATFTVELPLGAVKRSRPAA